MSDNKKVVIIMFDKVYEGESELDEETNTWDRHPEILSRLVKEYGLDKTHREGIILFYLPSAHRITVILPLKLNEFQNREYLKRVPFHEKENYFGLLRYENTMSTIDSSVQKENYQAIMDRVTEITELVPDVEKNSGYSR